MTTEVCPYGWGMTMLGPAFFNPGWRDRMRLDCADLRLVATGETLTRDSFRPAAWLLAAGPGAARATRTSAWTR